MFDIFINTRIIEKDKNYFQKLNINKIGFLQQNAVSER